MSLLGFPLVCLFGGSFNAGRVSGNIPLVVLRDHGAWKFCVVTGVRHIVWGAVWDELNLLSKRLQFFLVPFCLRSK